jgi:hydroxymethylglutaryl-CoA synthase
LTDELITAGVHPAAIRACFSPVESAAGDSVWDTDTGALKAAWEAEKSLRSTPLLAGLQRKMRLGARDMEELGNLYTGSLFAWLAAGLCEAASDAESREGLRRILLIGYGSGNAAEALVGEVVPGWTHRAAQLGVSSALRDPRDVTRDEYEMLRRGELRASGRTGSYFVIDRIGDGRSGPFDDTGIEHYRYVVGSETN